MSEHEGISPQRLADIRRWAESPEDHYTVALANVVPELLAEVDRLQKADAAARTVLSGLISGMHGLHVEIDRLRQLVQQ